MSGRMNWSAANRRRRVREHGAEPVETQTSRHSSARPKGQQPSEPVIIDRWWKNRAHDAVYVRLAPFKNMTLIDIRVWETSRTDGITRPGKGFSARVQHLARLHEALGKALAKARDLGLVERDPETFE